MSDKSLTIDTTEYKSIHSFGLDIQLLEYTEKSVALVGDTREIKDTLKQLGGKWNSRLKCGAGWIFPKSKVDKIKSTLVKSKDTNNDPVVPQGIKSKPISPPIVSQWDVDLRKRIQKEQITNKRLKVLEDKVDSLITMMKILLESNGVKGDFKSSHAETSSKKDEETHVENDKKPPKKLLTRRKVK